MTGAVQLLLYDTDCGPCMRFKRLVSFLDLGRSLEFMSIDKAEGLGILDGIPAKRRHGSFHLVHPDGRLESGADALPSLISLLPGGRIARRIIVFAPKGPSALKFLYSTAARLHEVGSCKASSALSA
ncbi:MAG TPA: DCC1-like thiol-disulfide oxidoreductase family protein [Nitrososphaerales archaeon]|nr:DCC1-like thiol-disulfide oxidoreductase family protein [Nitrososphaerales archaeon]